MFGPRSGRRGFSFRHLLYFVKVLQLHTKDGISGSILCTVDLSREALDWIPPLP